MKEKQNADVGGKRGRKRKANPFLDDMAEAVGGSGESEDEENDESDDSFIDDEEISTEIENRLWEKSKRRREEIAQNKTNLLRHIENLDRVQIKQIGLAFSYSNKDDIFE